ncbi:hypothetical protein TNCV_2192271 [Trichonephila clavipes]|nr:hypothetical protein TNCV_2192271 [Trichonephila clavipes]
MLSGMVELWPYRASRWWHSYQERKQNKRTEGLSNQFLEPLKRRFFLNNSTCNRDSCICSDNRRRLSESGIDVIETDYCVECF